MAANAFPEVLFLMGDDESLLSDHLKRYQQDFIKKFGEAMLDFNREILDGERDEAGKILDACATLPVGMERRLVILHRAEKVSSEGQEELERYLESPNPSTSFVALWNGSPNQKAVSKGLPAAAASKSTFVRCWKLDREDKKMDWIRARITQSGKEISLEALRALARDGGENLREIASEIEKVFLLVGARKKIEEGDVKRTLSFRPDQLVWDFVNALEGGQSKRAGQLMERCLTQGEEPIWLLNLVARSARRMPSRGGAGAAQLDFFKQIKDSDLALKSGHGVESGVLERLLAGYAALAS